MKKSKFLVLIALVLCFAMLFVACGKKDEKDGEATTTNPDAVENTGAPADSAATPEDDIALLVEAFNAEPSLSSTKEAIYKVLSGINVEVSDVKMNGEAIEADFEKVSIKDGMVYTEVEGVQLHTIIDNSFALLSLGTSPESSEVYAEIQDDILSDYFEELESAEIPVDESLKVEASDFTDEGNGVYSLKKAYFEDAIQSAIDKALEEEFGDEVNEEVTESINSFMDIVKACDIRVAYTVKNSKIEATEFGFKVSEEAAADLLELSGMPELNEKFGGEVKFVVGLTDNVPTSVKLDIDACLPLGASSREETAPGVNGEEQPEATERTVQFSFVDLKGSVSVDVNNLAGLNADVDYTTTAKTYAIEGENYVLKPDKTMTMTSEINAAITNGVFKFTTNAKIGEQTQTTEISAKVNIGGATIPAISDNAQEYLNKFNNIVKNKEAIDAFADELGAKILDKCTAEMIYDDILYTYDEYGIELRFTVYGEYQYDENGTPVFDEDGNRVVKSMEVEYRGFNFIGNSYYDYTVTVDGDSVTIAPKAGTVVEGTGVAEK